MNSIYYNGTLVTCVLSAVWGAITVAVATVLLVFISGHIFQIAWAAGVVSSVVCALCYLAFVRPVRMHTGRAVAVLAVLYVAVMLSVSYMRPFGVGVHILPVQQGGVLLALAVLCVFTLIKVLQSLSFGTVSRHDFEHAVIRFFYAVGYVFFTTIVALPFYVMVMTSLKSQQALLANPLDFGLDFNRGWHIFDSYVELFSVFNFGHYMGVSAFVSVLTVLFTLLVSIPGAYAIARLRFRGHRTLSASVLLVYLVPMIVLALPIYIVFSLLGLRNSLVGILMIYPVTTIPVALYMLQGYFRSIPADIEEAGLMDGLSRLQVIVKITLPLSLSAIASVSLYVFMIAWNEFLLAYMLLDDPAKFTLTRGISMLNSSEIPRQHLMAGSVVATVPVLIIFLGLERFMVKGLTAGSVK